MHVFEHGRERAWAVVAGRAVRDSVAWAYVPVTPAVPPPRCPGVQTLDADRCVYMLSEPANQICAPRMRTARHR